MYGVIAMKRNNVVQLNVAVQVLRNRDPRRLKPDYISPTRQQKQLDYFLVLQRPEMGRGRRANKTEKMIKELRRG